LPTGPDANAWLSVIQRFITEAGGSASRRRVTQPFAPTALPSFLASGAEVASFRHAWVFETNRNYFSFTWKVRLSRAVPHQARPTSGNASASAARFTMERR
jgi:hypothetical protein